VKLRDDVAGKVLQLDDVAAGGALDIFRRGDERFLHRLHTNIICKSNCKFGV
jgi:hypothetical protein